MTIRAIDATDYEQIVAIYWQGIATGIATFQTDVPIWEDWDKSHLTVCRIAIFENKKMLGWAALSPVSSRLVYQGVAEVSIYVAAESRGEGVGQMLLKQLIRESEKEGFWTLQSGIFTENISSQELHKKCGFREIGFRERIAKINEQWKDNIIMERRSKIIGI